MKRGVLILALGHNNYYQMAMVLAASIKSNDVDLPICLVTDYNVDALDAKLFDTVKKPTKKIISNGDFIKAKLWMYDFSPFEETIFLDADQVVLEGKKLVSVFNELKNIELTFSNTGKSDISVWADVNEVKKIYGDKPFWNFHSEFVYFKKSSETKKYFDVAKNIYNENKIKSANKFANGNMADELAFQCAAMVTGFYPHKENWLPNFWFDRGGNLSRIYPWQLTDYCTYSIGGNSIPQNVKNNYNILAKHYFAKLGLSNPYQVVDKKTFLPERKLI